MTRREDRIFLVALLIATGLAAMALAGCVSETAMWKASGSAAVLTSGAYRALDAADDANQRAAPTMAAFDAWRVTYLKARNAIDVLSAAVAGTPDAIKVVNLAVNKSKAAGDWIAAITKLGLDVVQALAAAGVHIPGGG